MKGRKSFLLRLEAELFRAVEEWAQQEMRSVNGQVEWILKEACERRFKKNLSGGAVEAAGGKTAAGEAPAGLLHPAGGGAGPSAGHGPGAPDQGRGEEIRGEVSRSRDTSLPRGTSGLEPLPIPHELTGAEPPPYLNTGAGSDPTLPLRLPDLTEGLDPPPRAG